MYECINNVGKITQLLIGIVWNNYRTKLISFDVSFIWLKYIILYTTSDEISTLT